MDQNVVVPSDPYERKSMAMELLLVMINVWYIHQLEKKESSQCASSSSLGTSYYHPYDQGLLLVDSTMVFDQGLLLSFMITEVKVLN